MHNPLSKLSLSHRNILLTGGSGCIGSQLAKALKSQGATLLLATSQQPESFKARQNVSYFHADFTNSQTHHPDYWQEVIESNDIDCVVNLAGGTSAPKSTHKHDVALRDINYYPVQAMATAISNVDSAELIYVSSMATKRVFPVELTEYSHSKFLAEEATRQVGGIIVRPDLVFSDHDSVSMRHAFSPNEVATLKMPLPVIGSGKQTLQPVSLSETIEGLCRLIENPSRYKGEEFDFVGPDIFSQIGLLSLFKTIRGEKFYPMFFSASCKSFGLFKELAQAVPYGSFNASLIGALENADTHPSVSGFCPQKFKQLLDKQELVSLYDTLDKDSLTFIKPPVKELLMEILSSSKAMGISTQLSFYLVKEFIKAILAGSKQYTAMGDERKGTRDISLADLSQTQPDESESSSTSLRR